MGLLLGASILSLVEIVDYLFFGCFRLNEDNGKKEQNGKPQVHINDAMYEEHVFWLTEPENFGDLNRASTEQIIDLYNSVCICITLFDGDILNI